MALKQGLLLVDTKYEFGLLNGEVVLIDEIHTPDSSRYFYAEGYEERQALGQEQKQLSKELEEENSGEEGYFADWDKVNKASVAARLKEMKGDKEAKEEISVCNEWLKLSGDKADTKKALEDAESDLDAKAFAKYSKLTDTEIKTLVVQDKWMATLAAAIHGEMNRISQALTQRVKELAERYEAPLPQLTDEVAALAAKVDAHLKKMGAAL